jgi:hypothetical protein
MVIKLNKDALAQARRLVKQGKVVHDEPGNWADDQPSPDDGNRLIEQRGWKEYATWHLGRDTDESAETKGRFSFVYGDFAKVHRCGVIAVEARAAQFDHDEIATAAKNLLALIDQQQSGSKRE